MPYTNDIHASFPDYKDRKFIISLWETNPSRRDESHRRIHLFSDEGQLSNY